jgi:hypothetical protein
VPILRDSKVVVYGYTQQFAVNPKVQVFWNGASVGTVKKGDCISFDIDADGEVSFRSSMRKASLRVHVGRVTNIAISSPVACNVIARPPPVIRIRRWWRRGRRWRLWCIGGWIRWRRRREHSRRIRRAAETGRCIRRDAHRGRGYSDKHPRHCDLRDAAAGAG